MKRAIPIIFHDQLDLACFPKTPEGGEADAKARDAAGQTLLHVAAKHGDVRAARLLLDRGAEVNARDNAGHPPCCTH